MIITQLEAVKEFMTLGGQINAQEDFAALRLSRHLMLQEELNELEEAMRNDDKLEQVDGVIDCVYVLLGSMLVMKEPLSEQGLMDLLKSAKVYKDNHLKKIEMMGKPSPNQLLAEIKNAANVLITMYDYVSLYFNLGLLLTLLFSDDKHTNLFTEAFDIVHTSNMSKVVDGELIKDENGKILKPSTYVSPSVQLGALI